MLSSFKNYLVESRAELKRVSWPNRDELIRLTTIVIGVSIFIGGFITLLDFMFSSILNSLV